ncbi:hypothetical protein F1737_08980 [Methanoplanus sp. FWC-SCC4]|uniref:Uncharacterized protein n=1 Tax=Methanochimaera problematica TaxID=2609417 RepID=A0AA97I3K4_9EURY|nr:hypothetical protein [Methanoplanus sp. FWC-SCC4]WOF16813.1 hypothetical protein F1737_08980 [Methanoplanus sp. FWC-SCC4]
MTLYFCNGKDITEKINACKGCDALRIEFQACNDLKGFIDCAEKCPRGKWEVKSNKMSQDGDPND